jgi:protein SCO1/2
VALSLVPLLLPHFHGAEYSDAEVIDFALPRADGGTFRLSDHRGDVVVLYFGYTQCPDVCPTTLMDLHRTVEELEARAEDVTVAFVTVDPARDTPEKMVDYLRYFDPSFIGLYGEPDELQRVYDLFSVTVLAENQTANGYGLAHTTSTFVIDRSGRLRLKMHYGAKPGEMTDDLKILLRERGS